MKIAIAVLFLTVAAFGQEGSNVPQGFTYTDFVGVDEGQAQHVEFVDEKYPEAVIAAFGQGAILDGCAEESASVKICGSADLGYNGAPVAVVCPIVEEDFGPNVYKCWAGNDRWVPCKGVGDLKPEQGWNE